MPDYFVRIETPVDNGITGHIVTLGGLKLANSKYLLKSSMASEDLRAALMQSSPDQLEITELADQQELEALKLKWLGEGAATAPPLEDFAAQMKAERWRLRE